MSRNEPQLSRAIAASPARPRTVLNAGHSNTAESVYSAPYAAASCFRYASTTRAFSESIPAVDFDSPPLGPAAQAASAMNAKKPATITTLRKRRIVEDPRGWTGCLHLHRKYRVARSNSQSQTVVAPSVEITNVAVPHH